MARREDRHAIRIGDVHAETQLPVDYRTEELYLPLRKGIERMTPEELRPVRSGGGCWNWRTTMSEMVKTGEKLYSVAVGNLAPWRQDSAKALKMSKALPGFVAERWADWHQR